MITLCRVLPMVGLLLILSAAPSEGLFPAPGHRNRDVPEWISGAECSISYYNACTGYVWYWQYWSGDRVGVVFDSGCQPGETATLVDSRVWCLRGAPAAYGCTGTISVHNVDADLCPVEPPLDSQLWLPAYGNNVFDWSTPVGEQFVIVATLAIPTGPWNPTRLVTDHPAHGPTGPFACGYCYPFDRTTRSFHWGTVSSPHCPGWTFFDGRCDAELVFDAGVDCDPPVSVEQSTWARIKGIYH